MVDSLVQCERCLLLKLLQWEKKNRSTRENSRSSLDSQNVFKFSSQTEEVFHAHACLF
jgi:hypothetical protein